MFQAFYVIQRLDTGEFVGADESGQLVYFINLARARLFQHLENAINHAKDLDGGLEQCMVHTIYAPCSYQPNSF